MDELLTLLWRHIKHEQDFIDKLKSNYPDWEDSSFLVETMQESMVRINRAKARITKLSPESD